MRELTLCVAAAETEEVLDAVLPALSGGVHIRRRGDVAELTIAAAPGMPEDKELRRLVGPSLIELSESEVSNDWRERRATRYEPLVVAERFLVRPDWAPASEDPALIEIVLERSAAFGSGVHPTTQACLAALAEIEPVGSLADYGCGSGVLSIAAAKLGFSPVIAVDVDETSVAAVQANAGRNEVELDARRVDLTSEPPPQAETVLANVRPPIHLGLAPALSSQPSLAILSGFRPDETEEVASAWGALGLTVADERQLSEWCLLVMQ